MIIQLKLDSETNLSAQLHTTGDSIATSDLKRAYSWLNLWSLPNFPGPMQSLRVMVLRYMRVVNCEYINL